MDRNARTGCAVPVPAWHFPVGEAYYDSFWHSWEDRINEGQQQDEQRVNRFLKSNPEGDEADQTAADDFRQSTRVTDAMSAALVVALWSNVEGTLKQLFGISQRAKAKSKKVPHEFPLIRKQFHTALTIDLGALQGYATVNTVRILNNSFKHNNGRYEPKAGDPDAAIDPLLLTRWGVLQASHAIDYAKLPKAELVAACGEFVLSLAKEVQLRLESQVPIVKAAPTPPEAGTTRRSSRGTQGG